LNASPSVPDGFRPRPADARPVAVAANEPDAAALIGLKDYLERFADREADESRHRVVRARMPTRDEMIESPAAVRGAAGKP